ncbi:MAG: TolC family protein, partial [Endomicrobium sp.]|nr:TolC family protein [Endomicrobium sp.]
SFVFAEKINKQMVEEQTLKNNPSVMLAKLELDNVKQEYKSSFSDFFPKISFTGGTGQDKSERLFTRNYSYGLKGSLSLFSGFSAYHDVKSKATKVKCQEAHYRRAVADAIYKSNMQYIHLMWAYERVELLKKIRKTQIENKDLVELKYHSGNNVDIGSLKRGEVDVSIVECDLRSAQRYVETASAALLVAIGRDGDATILETDERIVPSNKVIQKPDYNNLIATIPEFLIARYGVETCKFQKAATNSQWLPSVDVTGNISKVGDKWAPKHDHWDAGISLSYPIFTGGKRYYDSKIASNKLQEASLNLTNTTNSLKAQAIKYYNELIDAHEIIEVRSNCLSVSKLQSEIATRKYVSGLSNYYDWYAMESEYIRTQNEWLESKKNAALATAAWHNFIGDDFVKTKEEQK